MGTQAYMRKNIILFYIVRALFLPYFWVPVLYIYLTSVKGLNPAETALLLSLQEFLLIFLEVPTGVVADKISRRFSVGLGYLLAALPFVFLPLVNNYSIFILLFAIKATGKALVSGADTSLLYDMLVDHDRTNEYKRIINNSKALMMGVTAICIFLGGYMAQVGKIDWTLILPLPLAIIGAIAAFMMDEPETSKKAKEIQDQNYLLHTFHSLTFLVKRKNLLLLAVLFALVDATAVNMKWYYTPLFEALRFDLFAMGGITAVLYVVKSLFSAISAKVLKDEHNLRNILLFTILTAAAFTLSALFFVSPVIIISLLAIILFTESLETILSEEMHNRFESHTRATVMSMVNVFSSIIATLTLNGFGVIQLHASLQAALIFLAATFVMAFVIALCWKNSQ